MDEGDRPGADEERPHALVGWMAEALPQGCLLLLQVVRSKAAFQQKDIKKHSIALTNMQVRLLGEFLIQVADDREGKKPKKARWWTL